MFDLNPSIVAPIVAPIHIKHVHSSLSYQLTTYPKSDWRGRESPSGYGPLLLLHAFICG